MELNDLKQRIHTKQRAARVQEKRIDALDSERHAKHGALRERQIEADRLSVDVRAAEDRIARLRGGLNAAKTNKEYSALLTQINTDKADTAKVEERVLLLLNEIDSARALLASGDKRLEQERARLAELKRIADEFEQESADRLKELSGDRAAAAAAIPETVLTLFERVARKHDGQAMAQVICTNPKREEFACNGCNMAITLEQVNALMTRDEPILCHTCGRILYLERSVGSRAR